jgi:UDP-glucose 4-epimerase
MKTSKSSLKTVFITGGAGFLGMACARRFRSAGWRVVGLGHGSWSNSDASAAGYNYWINASLRSTVLSTNLKNFGQDLHAVIHCAGNGSVPYSLEQPLDAYEHTVGISALLFDYLRLYAPKAVVLCPSSAAVYGASTDRPLCENDIPNPVSPYGFHKLMVETLLRKHAVCFGQRSIAIRFFSIYGPGLRKQLLWDASNRLLSGETPLTFFGTGDETRDWIHVEDAASFMHYMAERDLQTQNPNVHLKVINGATGERIKIRDVLTRLSHALGVTADIKFNGNVRAGDPRFYHASVDQMQATGWRSSISLNEGLCTYARWIKESR